MELDSFFGLPAHPFIVHGAVVLVPLAVLGFIATGWRPAWRQRYGLVVLALSIVGAGMALLASESGEPFEEHVRNVAAAAGQARPRFGEHPELGETTAVLSFFFTAAVAGVLALERWSQRARTSTWMPRAAYLATTAIGVLALVWMVRTGHSGAQLVWDK